MCFAHIIISCRQCRKTSIRYRERCIWREEQPNGDILNHVVHGPERFIRRCRNCRIVQQRRDRALADGTQRDHRRGKAVLEHLQGRRIFPQTNDNLNEAQCRELYDRGQRLHPFTHDSREVMNISLEFGQLSMQTNNPFSMTILDRWVESIQRQYELDCHDLSATEADQSLRLQTIKDDADKIPNLPPAPLFTFFDQQSDERTTNMSSNSLLDSETYDTPETFAIWLTQRPPQQDVSEAPPAVGEVLCRHVREYEAYLSQSNFSAECLTKFRNLIATMRQNEIRNFCYTPLDTTGVPRMSFRDFNPGTPVSLFMSAWDIHLLAIDRYEEYLETPQHIAHFQRARASWAEFDLRELQGLPRDPLGEYLNSMRSRLSSINSSITHFEMIMSSRRRFMTRSERGGVTECIAELKITKEFIEQAIEVRATLNDAQNEEILMIMADAERTKAEIHDAIERGEEHELDPPATPSVQFSIPVQRDLSFTSPPTSEISDVDMQELLLELQRMANEEEEDNGSYR